MCCLLVLCLHSVSDTNACVLLLGKPWMDMDGVLIFLACFGRSLVYAGTLLTILDFLDGKGWVRASCLCPWVQGWELNPPVPGGVIQLCVPDGFLQISLQWAGPGTFQQGSRVWHAIQNIAGYRTWVVRQAAEDRDSCWYRCDIGEGRTCTVFVPQYGQGTI